MGRIGGSWVLDGNVITLTIDSAENEQPTSGINPAPPHQPILFQSLFESNDVRIDAHHADPHRTFKAGT